MPWLNYNKPLTTKSTQFQNVKSLHSDQVKDLLKASYKRNGEAEAIGKKNGFKLDHSLSNSEHKVFVDKDGNPDVVFTGTRKFGDVLTDGALAVGLGRFTSRFRNSNALVDKVKEKYKNKPLSVYGHSLGGSLAQHVGKKADKVVTLDKGVGIGGIGKSISNNQTDIRAGNDVISLLRNTQNGGKKITIKNTKYVNPLHAHDLSHITKLNQFV
jgi:hypothetical protein